MEPIKSKNQLHKISGSLILSGAMEKIEQSKLLHAALIIACYNDWKVDKRGYFKISMYQLHRLTGSFHNYDDIIKTADYIKRNVELDWAKFYTHERYIRKGHVSVISHAFLEYDKKDKKAYLLYKITEEVLEYVIKPNWWASINLNILFSIKSNYAFQTYLIACLYSDKKGNKRYSHAYTIKEWRELLAIPDELTLRRIKFNIFKRSKEIIESTAEKHGVNIQINFNECNDGRWQLVVSSDNITNGIDKNYCNALLRKEINDNEEEKKEFDTEMKLNQLRAEKFLKFFSEETKLFFDRDMTEDEHKIWRKSLIDSQPHLNPFQETWILDNYIKIDPKKHENWKLVCPS